MKYLLFVSGLLMVLSATASFSATPGFDTLVNYDTAWTYVYDGGSKLDLLYDVKMLSNGVTVCVSESGDTTTGMANTVLIKFDTFGRVLQKKLYNTNNVQSSSYNSQYARSIAIAKNGDFIIAGARYVSPFVMRTDSLGNLKWATWLWDSTNNRYSLLNRGATINSVQETSRGTIICAAGDYFTDAAYMYGVTKTDYAAYIELNAGGDIIHWGRWSALAGYNLGAFNIEEAQGGNFILSGNQAVLALDTIGHIKWNNAYTFTLDSVGSEVNNITRCKKLRNGKFIVAGQAYEGNCWTKYKKLYYDAWWSPINQNGGSNVTWDTAGYQGGDDRINDFTQLANGNLVFIGKRNYSNAQTSGIWVYVTPDSGSHILWEKVVAGSMNGAEPLSVCATPDSGFTVVGKIGGNAFASHFVPKAPLAVSSHTFIVSKAYLGFRARVVGTNLILTSSLLPAKTSVTVSLYSVSGKRIALPFPLSLRERGRGEVVFNMATMAKGTYFVKLLNNTTNTYETGKIVY